MQKTTSWNNCSFLCFKAIIILILSIVGSNSFASKVINEKDKIQAQQFLSQKNQFGFQENKGQIKNSDGKFASNVLYKTEVPGLTIWITTSGLTYQFLKTEKSSKEKLISEWHRVDMNFKDAHITKDNVVTEGDITKGETNYYLAHCKQGVTNVRTYSKITIKNIYEGIDWVIYTDNKFQGSALKQDFIVHPNADPNQIKLIYEGSGQLNVKDNQIHFENAFGEMNEGQLFCYQDENNEIKSNYVIKSHEPRSKSLDKTSVICHPSSDFFSYEVSIALNHYDKSKPLVIDPELVWATFYGGNDNEGSNAIETDVSGNTFIVGYTSSVNFPVFHPGGNAYQGIDSADTDAAILKFTNTGELIWATYYGGNKTDKAHSLCLDLSGNVYVVGLVKSTDFPLLNLFGAYNQATNAGMEDAFILKFTSLGQRLWATYYGGTLSDYANGICSDVNENIFVTGYTTSSSFPVFNAGGATYFDGSINSILGGDVFLLKFASNGQRFWATYYGGDGDDIGNSICTDSNGDVLVTGSTTSSIFPVFTFSGAYNQNTSGGDVDAFILKFDNTGGQLWSSYFGGSLEEIAYTIFCDNFGTIFVTGKTKSTSTFPLVDPGNGAYYQATNGGGSDAFLLKFATTGQLLWSTFYGGIGDESFDSYDNIAADGCGNIYFTFNTLSANMPLQSNNCLLDYNKITLSGNKDIFLLKFNNSGNRLWTSYLGGDGDDLRSSIAVNKSNNFIVTGTWSAVVTNASYSTVDPGGTTYFDGTYNGNEDMFIVKFKPVAPTYTASQVNSTGNCNNCNGSATINMQCSDPKYSYVWSNGSQTLNVSSTTNTVTGLCPGTYSVSVSSGCIESAVNATFTITGGAGSTLPNIAVGNSLALGCTPTSGTISATSTTSGVNYSWQGPGIVSGGATSTPIVNTAGTYTVTVTNTITGCSSTATVAVTNDTIPPVITAGNPITLTCANNNGTISVNSSTSGVSYTWQGPGIVSGGSTSTPTVNATGTYTVTVTNATSGCTNTATVQVNSNVSIPSVIGGSSLTLTCNVNSGTISASSVTPGVTYSWSGSGIVSGGSSTAPIVNLPGTYTVTVTDSSTGCTNTATVLVNSNTLLPNVISANTALIGCLSTSTSLSASSTTLNVFYNWTGPGIVSGAGTSTTIVNAVGNYTVTVTDFNNGCTATAVVSVNQSVPPTASVSPDVTINLDNSTTLTATGGGTYNWYPAAGLSCTTCANPVATPLETTNYCVAVTDTNGCSDTACVRIEVIDLCPPVDSTLIPNVFSPNGDNKNDFYFIEGWNDVCIENFAITIYNRWGQIVFQTEKMNMRWDGVTPSGTPSSEGAYFYTISIKRKRTDVKVYKGTLMLVR